MQAVRKALIAAASAGAIMAVVGASPAEAGGINFTWNPNGSSPPISSSASSEFTGNDLTIADYANVVITSTGANTFQGVESALLNVTGVNNVVTPGLGGGTGAYQLYFSITATATATGTLAGGLTGYFTTVSYSLIGVAGAGCTFAATSGGVGTSGCGATQVLATGTLVPGQVTSGSLETNYVTTAPVAAGAIVSITPAAGESGFFVDPTFAQISNFEFITDFTNNVTNLTGSTPLDIVINGGGGDVNLLPVPVPEPLTISLFGAGLAGAAALRRRRSKKA